MKTIKSVGVGRRKRPLCPRPFSPDVPSNFPTPDTLFPFWLLGLISKFYICLGAPNFVAEPNDSMSYRDVLRYWKRWEIRVLCSFDSRWRCRVCEVFGGASGLWFRFFFLNEFNQREWRDVRRMVASFRRKSSICFFYVKAIRVWPIVNVRIRLW